MELLWRRLCRSHAVGAMLPAGLGPASPRPARRAGSRPRARPRATSSPPCSTCCLEHSAHHRCLTGPCAAHLSIRGWIINSSRTGIVPLRWGVAGQSVKAGKSTGRHSRASTDKESPVPEQRVGENNEGAVDSGIQHSRAKGKERVSNFAPHSGHRWGRLEEGKWPRLADTCVLVCVCLRQRGSVRRHPEGAKMQKPGAVGTRRAKGWRLQKEELEKKD